MTDRPTVRRVLLTLVLCVINSGLLAKPSVAPPSVLNLGNHWIGAERDVVFAMLGKPTIGPIQDGDRKCFMYEVKANLQAVFSVCFADSRPDYTMDVQVTGPVAIEGLKLHGLEIGDSRQRALELLGKPSRKLRGAHPASQLYVYDRRNYSIEVVDDKVFSIKVSAYDGWLDATEWPATWQAYRVGGLNATLKLLANAGGIPEGRELPEADEANWMLAAPVEKVVVRARFTGGIRGLRDVERELLRRWSGGVLGDEGFAARFSRCIEVTEGSVPHCIALQEVLVDDFEAEVGVGDSMDMFAVLIGAVEGLPGFFVANEFQTYGPMRGPEVTHSEPPVEESR